MVDTVTDGNGTTRWFSAGESLGEAMVFVPHSNPVPENGEPPRRWPALLAPCYITMAGHSGGGTGLLAATRTSMSYGHAVREVWAFDCMHGEAAEAIARAHDDFPRHWIPKLFPYTNQPVERPASRGVEMQRTL